MAREDVWPTGPSPAFPALPFLLQTVLCLFPSPNPFLQAAWLGPRRIYQFSPLPTDSVLAECKAALELAVGPGTSNGADGE